MVEAAVRKMMKEMNVGSSNQIGKDENSIASFIDSETMATAISNLTPTGTVKSKSGSARNTKDDSDDKSETRSNKKTKKSKKSKKTKSINSSDKKKKKPKKMTNAKIIEELLTELTLLKKNKNTLEVEIPSDILLRESKRDGSNMSSTRSISTRSIGSVEFYDDIAAKLKPHHKKLGLRYESPLPTQGSNVFQDIEDEEEEHVDDNETGDFHAAFGPNDMRCLALVSHNDMKSTMKEFVIHYKHTLKKFRLTGTNSTMKMLKEVFADEPSVVFGPECKSGPLGGDAELVAHMTSGKLGGILFFQDPMSAHPHQADIDCLVRQAQVHNTIMANTPTTAMALVEFFRMALIGEGRPQLLPSFFFDLESPVVRSYKTAQKKVVNSHKTN